MSKLQKARIEGVFLSLTDKCNLDCKYCYQGSSPTLNSDNELKKEEWIRLIKELKKLKVKKIRFVGGEPFLYKHFLEILDYSNKEGFKIKVFTNGILLDKQLIRKVKECEAVLSFNLNSEKEKVQDFYQGKGSWKKTINAIKKCKKENIEFEIASPLTNKNIKSIEKFIVLCTNLGAKRIRFVPLILIGKDSVMRKDKPSKKQIKELEEKIKNKKIEVTIGCRSCEAGINYLTIQSNGDVTPCSINKTILGNIKKTAIEKIINEIRKPKTKFKNICKDIK
ncbi:hypothetical protein A3K73_00450 [Candidatus Pacearchaeota archaeon RBG_13_36_9]|nr:MAG: hypothetical protein A3K73_00450 [Candidatus Pacearchaeota archaeon RBG_13_36_9]